MELTPADKIRSLDEIAVVAEQARAEGRVVVLAHGTFDLMHFGHVRHLQAARREGDLLIVTITADHFVNKGPGRPIFPHAIRAEMLASLECVDFVGINHAASAESVLHTVKPQVYVKGNDYASADDDVTGKIVDEQRVVESHGGRIVFTNEITFSSSSLINRHLDIYDPTLRSFLEQQRARGGLDELQALIEQVKDYKVLIVGDSIVDEYQYVSPMGRSAKENMIATLYKDRELFAGGVAAAANHVAAFCGEVEILTALGSENSYEDFLRSHLKPNVRMWNVTVEGAPTIRKSRFVDQSYLRKLFEVYFMDDTPLSGVIEERFIEEIRRKAPRADLVIVTDFGHGLITPRVIEALTQSARFLAVNAQSNSANIGYNLITKYPRADYVCIDAPEARLAISDKWADIDRIVSQALPARIDCDRMIITNGRHGCVTRGPGEPLVHIPAFTKTVVDTVGAGDAFFAVTAPLVAAGGTTADAGFIGNVAGALKVGIVGHRKSVEKGALLKYIQTLLK
jgi:rfaE bifunctional protein kinase chain/domain/rfaE bifunctional protein nucleotidyltransferase chain/domain